MTDRRSIIIISLLAVLLSCGGGRGESASRNGEASPGSGTTAEALPAIPPQITDPSERLNYLIQNYWASLRPDDDSQLNDTAALEQRIVNYLDLLARADSARAGEAFLDFLSRIPKSGEDRVCRIVDRYLYDPESPIYNAELYLAVIDASMAHADTDETRKTRLALRHEGLMKNRRGTKATDFTVQLTDGRITRLSAIAARTPETILIFYDPDCDVCHAAISRLSADESIERHIANGTLQVVAVDPFDSDLRKWAQHAEGMPPDWTVGYAEGVDERELYLLRATPTIYVLGSDMTVKAQDTRL